MMGSLKLQDNDVREKQIDLLNLLIKKRAGECIQSLYEFVKEFWDIVSSEQLVDNWHIKYICDELQEVGLRVVRREESQYDLIINIPPGLTKSTIVSVMFPVWIWLHRPDIVVINSSYSGILSTDHSLKSKTIFKSDRFTMYFRNHYLANFGARCFLVKDTEKYWLNNYGGARYSTSTGGTVTGKHADIIIRDDPMNPEQANSEANREACHRFNDRTLSSRKKDKDKTPTITVMQRLDIDDTTGHDLLKTGKELKHICLPAELTADVKPAEVAKYYKDGLLDPVRLSKKTLEKAKIDFGSYAYTGQMLMNPTIEGGNLIKSAWFMEYTMAALSEQVTSSKGVLKWMYTMDGAYTEKETNDPTALMCWAVWKNCLYIRDIAVIWMEMPDLVRFIPEFAERTGYNRYTSKIYIEPKANGISVAQVLKRETKLNIILDEPPKSDKVARAKECLPFIESGRVYLLKGSNYINPFLHEIGEFPMSSHDDQVDVLTMAIRRTIKPEKPPQRWHS